MKTSYSDKPINIPLVSIVMNCYNSEQFLAEALDSVLAQTYVNWELVFWDNQSTDNSAKIVKGVEDPRIKYFYSENHTSLGEARNRAVACTRGEWVAFLDCDDVWMSEKLEKQINLLGNDDERIGLIYGGMEIIGKSNYAGSNWSEDLQKKVSAQDPDKFPEGNIFPDLLKFNYVPLVTGLVRKKYFIEVGGINPLLEQAEDYDLFLKISKISEVRVVKENICYYRVHDNNITQKNLSNNFEEAISVVEQFLPLEVARKGVSAHQTYYAIYQIRSGLVFEGLVRLFHKGSVKILFLKLCNKVFGW